MKRVSKQITLFKKYSNVAFEFWHFPPGFVLLKLTCLVTLFDRKLQVFKNSPKWTIFGPLKNVNVARFIRNLNETFSVIFKHRANSDVTSKICLPW